MLPGLRQRRLRRALTQAELAELAGVQRQTIIKLEQGRPASMATVRALCGALDCQPVDLFTAPRGKA